MRAAEDADEVEHEIDTARNVSNACDCPATRG